MGIYLGNLSVKQIEERLEIVLSEEDREVLKNSQEENASNVPENKWHGFDIPFIIVCGSMDMAIKVRDILSKYDKDMKGTLQIGISQISNS